jgi:hypothetical protein
MPSATNTAGRLASGSGFGLRRWLGPCRPRQVRSAARIQHAGHWTSRYQTGKPAHRTRHDTANVRIGDTLWPSPWKVVAADRKAVFIEGNAAVVVQDHTHIRPRCTSPRQVSMRPEIVLSRGRPAFGNSRAAVWISGGTPRMTAARNWPRGRRAAVIALGGRRTDRAWGGRDQARSSYEH